MIVLISYRAPLGWRRRLLAAAAAAGKEIGRDRIQGRRREREREHTKEASEDQSLAPVFCIGTTQVS